MAEFTLQVEAAIGPAVTEADFVDKLEEFQIPTFEPYEDKDTKPTVIPDRDNFDTFDQYIGIKLLSTSNEVQTKTQVKRTIPSPEISYLCQLSQSQGHTPARVEHKQSHVHSIIHNVLHKQKQHSWKDNLLSSLY